MLPLCRNSSRVERLKLSGCLFILSMILPLRAHSGPMQVEYAGDLYDVTTQSTRPFSFTTHSPQLLWWNDMTMASYFANAVADAFGYPNIDGYLGNDLGYLGPAFVTAYAWGINGRPWEGVTASCFNPLSQVAEKCSDTRASGNRYYDTFRSFAVATKVSNVPLPATAWLFLSALSGLGWLRRVRPSSTR